MTPQKQTCSICGQVISAQSEKSARESLSAHWNYSHQRIETKGAAA